MSDDREVAEVRLPIGDDELSLAGYVGEYLFETVRGNRRFYEEDLLEYVSGLPLAPGAIIDVGANIGNHTVYLAASFRDSKIIAVEPFEPNIEMLRRNIAANDFDDRVEVVAAVAADGANTYELSPRISTNLGTVAATQSDSSATRSVVLDDLIGDRPVSLIKIDVEGMEPAVLRGLSNVILQSHPVIVTEAHDPVVTRTITAFLHRFGYEIMGIRGRSRNIVWAAPGHALDEHAVDTAHAQATAESLFSLSREVRAARDGVVRELKRTHAVEDAARREEIETWRGAFTNLSRMMEVVAPHAWDHSVATGGEPRRLADGRGTLSPDITPAVDRERVRVGMATMPGREASLAKALASLAPQADEVFVWLNDMSEPPPGIPSYENVRYFTGEDLGDRGKFMFLDGFAGYYLTCDDDIHYPKHYVDSIIAGIERYGRNCAVGWHGSIFLEPFDNYYDPKSRRVFTYYARRPDDTRVHLLGTGATGFHTSTVSFSMSDMPIANMADVWFAIRARETEVPLVVLKHDAKLAYPLDREAPSISNSSLATSTPSTEGSGRGLDMRAVVTREVSSRAPWPAIDGFASNAKSPMSVTIVGRTDRSLWKKGGIVKSCHLTADMLRKFGTEVTFEDVESGEPLDLHGADPEIVIVYLGDPERPDFARATEIVEHHAGRGRVVVVNLSLEGSSERARFIVDRMQAWNRDYGRRIQLMVFTNAARDMPELAEIRDRIVTLPKTIDPLLGTRATFAGTRGVFVGDIAKLSDPQLIGGDAREWIEALRGALPGVPLIGVQQYIPRYDLDLGLDQVWPYLHKDLAERLASVRTMVSLVERATYEMVPVEAASLGVPVFYRNMPQSLSETIGLAGIPIESPAELASTIGEVYWNPTVWRSFSLAGERAASAADIDAMAGHFYLRLKSLVER